MAELGLRCMNCHQEVPQEEAKLFAQVFVCPTCYTQAEHFWLKLDRELRSLLVMAKESIRLALTEGRFSFPEGPAADVSKREVLQAILEMHEAREAKTACDTTTSPSIQTIPSTGSTQQFAPK